MLRLDKIEKSPYGKGEVWQFKCDSCGHIERVSSSFAVKVKKCVICGDLVEDMTVPAKIEDKDELALKRIRALYRRISKKCESSATFKMCDEWKESIDEFVTWSLKNGYKSWCQFYRYDDSKDYSPDNCYWANQKIKKGDKITDNQLQQFDAKLQKVGLRVGSIAKDLQAIDITAKELEEVVDLLIVHSDKDSIARDMDNIMAQVISKLKQLIVLQQSYNYITNNKGLDDEEINKFLISALKLRKKL